MDSNKALLIIDAQVNMFDEQMPIYDGARLLQTLASLVQQARAAGAPVIFVRNNGSANDPDKPGTPGWEIHPALKPLASEAIIDKFSPNSFHETDLHQLLQAAGVTNLVLAGMQTEFCVDATCRRAVELGYDVAVAADAHSTFDMEEMTAAQAIEHYNQKFSTVATTEKANEITFL